MAEVVGRCGRRKQRNPRKKNDVSEEHKLSESAALATARVTTSDDEDGSNKKHTTNSNSLSSSTPPTAAHGRNKVDFLSTSTDGLSSQSENTKSKGLSAQIENSGSDVDVTVTAGLHGNETRDGRCGTGEGETVLSRTDSDGIREVTDGLKLARKGDRNADVEGAQVRSEVTVSESKGEEEKECKKETTLSESNVNLKSEEPKRTTNLENTTPDELPKEGKTVCHSEPREVNSDNIRQTQATIVAYPESSFDHDEENQLQNEEHILEEEYMLKCIYCESTSTKSSLLRDHMRNQHPDKPVRYQCPKCEQTFLLKSHLDKHLAMHSPTSQSCKVCQKTFANVYRLQRHMISHSESTDLRKFKCPECGKAFKFKHHLKEHIRIHSGEKPFQCPTCSKRFSHSGSYSSHMTSKKCWVIGQSKSQARRQERQMEQGRGKETGTSSSNYQGGPETGQFMFPGVGQVYTQPMTSPPPGAYPQQFMTFDQHPTIPSLRHQFYAAPPPPMTSAMMTSAQNAFAFSLYQQKLSSSTPQSTSGMAIPQPVPSSMSPVPAHQQPNIPFHLLSSAHNIATAHSPSQTVSSHVSEGHSKKTPVLLDTLLSGQFRKAIRPVTGSHAGDICLNNPTALPSPSSPNATSSDRKRGCERDELSDKSSLSMEHDINFTSELIKRMKSQTGNKLETDFCIEDRADQDIDTPEVKEEILSDEDGEKVEKRSLGSSKELDCEDMKEESSSGEDISDLIVGEVKLEMNDTSDGEVQTCRYCKQQFHSPIDLHQHERYLCQDNHDIKRVMSSCKVKAVSKLDTSDEQKVKDEVNRCSPLSSRVSDDETEDMEDEDDDEEEEEDDDEEEDDEARLVFKSSKLTENQAQHLRGCYRDNKKPDDHAMEEIAKIIGATKKMVQVWFQSARAREKRKMMRSKPTLKSNIRRNSSGTTTSTSPSTYIPIVPNPYAVFSHHKRYSKFSSTSALSPVGMNFSSIGPLTPQPDEQPLDLSVRKQQPPKAHQQKNSSLLPLENLEGHVLNLSNKVPKLEPVSPSLTVKLESPNSATMPRCSSRDSTSKSSSSLPNPPFSPLSIPNQHFLHIPDPHAKQFPHPMLNH